MDTETIRELQTMLRALSFVTPALPPIVVDGIGGNETENAVRIFQSLYGLPITGTADIATWAVLVREYRAVTKTPVLPLVAFPHPAFILRPGETDDLSLLVAYILNTLATVYPDLPTVTPDRRYHAETVAAIRRLQELHGLEANGEIDRITWNLLTTLYNDRSALMKG